MLPVSDCHISVNSASHPVVPSILPPVWYSCFSRSVNAGALSGEDDQRRKFRSSYDKLAAGTNPPLGNYGVVKPRKVCLSSCKRIKQATECVVKQLSQRTHEIKPV